MSLLTDFGARDPSAGICRAVVLGIASDALVVDISHEVQKYAVRDAALLLWCAVPYLPVGAHVAVVDPGVGTERRGIAVETARGDYLVGPDNGILLPAATRLGGILRAQSLENPQYRLPTISSSFHGRDIFAPAAAHLSMGVPLEFLGPAVDLRTLVMLEWPEPDVYEGLLRTSVIYLDTFGNVKLSALVGDLHTAIGPTRPGERLHLRIEDRVGTRDLEVPWTDTFGRVAPGVPLLYEDSYGRLCLAVNQGSAVAALGIRENAIVTVTRVPLPRAASVVSPDERPSELDAPAEPEASIPSPVGAAAEASAPSPVTWDPGEESAWDADLESEPTSVAEPAAAPTSAGVAEAESEAEADSAAEVEPAAEPDATVESAWDEPEAAAELGPDAEPELEPDAPPLGRERRSHKRGRSASSSRG